MIRTDLYNQILLEGIDADTALMYLLAIKYNLNPDIPEELFQYFVANNFIRRDFILNRIEVCIPILTTDSNIEQQVDISSRVDEYRSLFKGIRPKSLGSKPVVIEMLNNFIAKYGYSFDEILTVTEKMVSATERQFIPNADNFIYSIDRAGRGTSGLLNALEEQSMNPEINRVL